MTWDPGAVENCKREARKSAHVYLVGGQVIGGAGRIVVGELHVRQLRISIVLAFVDDHSQHVGHCVVNALHTTVIACMLGAGGDSSNTKKLIYDVGKLGAELEAVVREDFGHAFSCKLSGGDCKRVRPTAKAVGETRNIGVTPGRERQWPKRVHAYRNARSRREENRDDGPMNLQSWCLPRLALQAMAQPPAGT